MSETPKIFAAMNAVMTGVQSVGKDGKNNSQNYKFRGIDAVVNAVGPEFRKCGVMSTSKILDVNRSTVSANGKATREVSVTIEYTFHCVEDGSSVSTVVVAEAMDWGDKATAKVMSVAYRTALLQILCIPTDDPDPDEYSYERSAPAQRPAVREPAVSRPASKPAEVKPVEATKPNVSAAAQDIMNKARKAYQSKDCPALEDAMSELKQSGSKMTSKEFEAIAKYTTKWYAELSDQFEMADA